MIRLPVHVPLLPFFFHSSLFLFFIDLCIYLHDSRFFQVCHGYVDGGWSCSGERLSFATDHRVSGLTAERREQRSSGTEEKQVDEEGGEDGEKERHGTGREICGIVDVETRRGAL